MMDGLVSANVTTLDPETLIGLEGVMVTSGAIPRAAFVQEFIPGPEPISLAKAKDHLRVVVPDEDDYIASLISAARVMAEGRLNRTLAQRQLVAAFPAWCARMALPKPPLVSVDSVGYLDTDGAEQTLAAYDVQEYAVPAVVALPYGAPAPALRWRPDAIRITYTAGYADGQVPASILQWMLLVIGTLYDNRATSQTGAQSYSLPEDFMQWMLQPHMVYE